MEVALVCASDAVVRVGSVQRPFLLNRDPTAVQVSWEADPVQVFWGNL